MADPRPLTRQELSKFLPDQRSIRAFEKLFQLIPNDLLSLLSSIETVRNEAGLALSQSLANTQRINDQKTPNIVFVYDVHDLPRPKSGVITLIALYTYYFTSDVDLLGSRLECGQSTVIIGSSSENSIIKSTGLDAGQPLISSAYTLPMRHITLDHDYAFNLDATGQGVQALDWYGVNIVNCPNIGLIKNYSNFIASSSAFLSCAGLVFDGSVGTIGFSNSLMIGDGAGVIITVPDTTTITRRLKITDSSIVVFGSSIGLDVSELASIESEGYILRDINFSGGGVYTQGLNGADNKSRWSENRGVENSATLTGYYIENNNIETEVTANTPTKAVGFCQEMNISQRFSVATTNRATYTGAIKRNCKIGVACSLSSGNNQQIKIYIYKNGSVIQGSGLKVSTNAGGKAEGAVTFATASLEVSDYIEFWVENTTSGSSIVIESLNLTIEGL